MLAVWEFFTANNVGGEEFYGEVPRKSAIQELLFFLHFATTRTHGFQNHMLILIGLTRSSIDLMRA